MYVRRLLQTGPAEALRGALLVTCLAGLANAALIGLVNEVAERAALGRPTGGKLLALYILLFLVFYIANRASVQEANRFVQRRLGDLRLRLADKIRRADLRALERLGQGELYAVVAQETAQLAQTFPLLVSAGQSVFLLLFLLLYIATLSLISFAVVAGFIALGLYGFWRRRQVLSRAMVEVHDHEARMLDSLGHYAEGFQEIRLNADKNDALHSHFTGVAEGLRTAVVGVGDKWVGMLQFSNAFLYALVGVVIFVLPLFFSGYTGVIYKIVAAAIFCLGPVTALTAVSRLYDRADVGLGHVFRLEQRLNEGLAESGGEADADLARYRGLSGIELRGIRFDYREVDGTVSFRSGPWDLDLRRGEIVFLVGGNGSGKSTAMKLICGLYTPDAGEIRVDGEPVAAQTRQAYRELFSAVFADFHLFQRLHGLEDVDPARVEALIERMGLADKVRYEDGRFSTLELSTGQRKRLAMIVALLEDRDCYLFDEWAADQDSHFREIFYRELLPELKARGKIVVAVTHDDRYWSCCDRRLVLDLGRMQAAETV